MTLIEREIASYLFNRYGDPSGSAMQGIIEATDILAIVRKHLPEQPKASAEVVQRSLDPRNDRICYYEGIMRAFVDVHGFCNIRGAAEQIVQLEEKTEQPVESPLSEQELDHMLLRRCKNEYAQHDVRDLVAEVRRLRAMKRESSSEPPSAASVTRPSESQGGDIYPSGMAGDVGQQDDCRPAFERDFTEYDLEKDEWGDYKDFLTSSAWRGFLSGWNQRPIVRKSVALSDKTMEIAKWVASPEGQESLKKASAEVADMLAKFEEDRRLDPELLRKPMTI
jgi:hypothetical protein